MEAVFRWGATFLVTLVAFPYAVLGLVNLWPDYMTLADLVRYLSGFIAGSIATAISLHFNTS